MRSVTPIDKFPGRSWNTPSKVCFHNFCQQVRSVTSFDTILWVTLGICYSKFAPVGQLVVCCRLLSIVVAVVAQDVKVCSKWIIAFSQHVCQQMTDSLHQAATPFLALRYRLHHAFVLYRTIFSSICAFVMPCKVFEYSHPKLSCEVCCAIMQHAPSKR